MSASRNSRFISVVVLIVYTVLASTFVFAQTTSDDRNEIEFIGIVQALGDGTVTINGQVITLGTAEVGIPLTVGELVEVEGFIDPSGVITAREIGDVDDDAIPGEAEVEGRVTAIEGTTIIIGGQVIDLTAAEVAAGIVVGDYVKVHASLTDDGIWQARQVRLDDDPDDLDDNDDNNDDDDDDDFEITGTLESINGNTLVVSGQTIDITGAEIKGNLVTGAIVKIEFIVVNGITQVREVETGLRFDDDDDDSDFFDDIHDDTDDDSDDLDDDLDDDDDDDSVSVIDCSAGVPEGWVTYTIQRGDTLSGIAGRSGSSVAELAQVNCLQNTRFIVLGAQIYVPRPITSPPSDDSDSRDDDDDNGSDDNNDDDDNGQDDNDDNNDDRNQGGNNDDDDNGGDDDSNDDDDNGGDDDSNDDDDNGDDNDDD